MAMQCAYHPDREPVGACVECGRLICAECKTAIKGKFYCPPCADKVFVHKSEAAAAATEAAQAAVAPPPAAAQPAAAAARPVAATQIASTSAEGGELAEQLKRWSWGAFSFNWIWGIVNRVWISFLVFVPLLGIVWVFILGAKGHEWAWKAKKWESPERFVRVQRIWNTWGLVLFIIFMIVVAYVIVSVTWQLLAIGGHELFDFQ